MTAGEGQRKLAAILAADVVGYSRLMAEDERATMRTLMEYRTVFTGHVNAHNGRVVDTAGDSVLAAFESVVEAVEAAVEIQRELAGRNDALDDHRRMHFRIGVNLGDVLLRDGTVYGDGVNVASRLEGLAEPGGINLSGAAFDQTGGRLSVAFDYVGEKEVKNIAQPVRVYKAVSLIKTTAHRPSAPASAPERPSIAVLPFENLNGDRDQDYIGDGIVEDLITELSRLRWLHVIARSSTFTYKGQAVDIRHVGRDLGVGYVLEGSVRRGGNRVRITAQLIEAASGNHIWAEKFDRDLDQIFAFQDEVTSQLAAAIEPEIGAFERQLVRRRPPENLTAWESYQRGLSHFYRLKADDLATAQQFFQRAIAVDPMFSQASAWLAYCMFARVFFGLMAPGGNDLDEAIKFAKRAIELDAHDAMGHFSLGRIETIMGHHHSAIERLRRAVALNPNLAIGHHGLGFAVAASGRASEALGSCEQAIRLSPRGPLLWMFESMTSLCHMFLGRFDTAIQYVQQAAQDPNASIWVLIQEAAILGHLGRINEAKTATERVLAEIPGFSIEFFHRTIPGWHPAYLAMFVDGLRKAGMSIEYTIPDSD